MRLRGAVMPSMRFDDSVLWMIATCRKVSSTWGVCRLKRSSLPRYSPIDRTVRSTRCGIGSASRNPGAKDFIPRSSPA